MGLKPQSSPLEGLWPVFLTVGLALLVALFSEVIAPAHAEELARARSFWDDRARGYFWYEDPSKKIEVPKPEQPAPITGTEALSGPRKELKDLQNKLETAKADAVLHPTPEKIRAYIIIHQEVLDKSAKFTDQWRRTQWSNPELDTSLVHPTSAVGAHIDRANDRSVREQAARELSQTDGVFFFFKEGCPYCTEQAPILKRFADRFGINVLAISLDGSRLPEFPDAVDDNGWATRMGVTVTPTMYMVNPTNNAIAPLAHGLVTEDEILNRVYVLSQARLGQF